MSDAPRWTPPSDPGAGADGAPPAPWSAPVPPVPPAPPVAPPDVPPASAPPADAAPASAPPGYAPPGYAPPGYATPGYAPPGYLPPAGAAPGYAPPGYAPPGYAAPGYASGAPGLGWTPPPKPGLVPLRPMTLGTILGAMFRVMRRNPLPTLGLALLLSLLGGGAVAALITVGIAPLAFTGAPTTASGVAGTLAVSFLAGVVAVVVQLILTSVVQGVVTVEVASGTLGERMRLSGLWRRVRSRVLPFIGWLVLVGIAAAILVVVLALITAAVASAGDGSAAGAILVGVLGTLGLLVLFAWLGVKLLFVAPVIVLERRGPFAATARSWILTRGYFWRIFGIMALVVLIYGVASWIVAFPIQIIASLLIGLLGTDPTGATGAAAPATLGVLYGVSVLVNWLIGAIGLIMTSASTALLYIDTRMRREGLDLELVRAAELRAAGAPFPDPYAPPPA